MRHLKALLALSMLCGACVLTTAGEDASLDAGTARADAAVDAMAVADAPGTDRSVVDHATSTDHTARSDAASGQDLAPRADASSAIDAAGLPLSDCSAISASWELCATGRGSCSAVFTDSAGCAAVCAAAGMGCGAVYEDLGGQCAPDLSLAQLTCDPATGHQSDYCVCVDPAGCARDCGGRQCGSDGCGGQCGICDAGERCVAGTCSSGPAEDCSSYPFRADTLLAERVGFGRNARGGDPGNVYRVQNLSGSGPGSLRAALESAEDYWIVFDVEGVITHDTEVSLRSNKTVDGRGRDITVRGTWRLQDVRDVIISDIKVENDLEGHCTQAGDVILITGTGGVDPASYSARDIWLNHVEAYNGGDGLIDIRGGSDITLSWNHVHTHKKGLLCWQTQDNQPAPGMRVTFHHNFFDRISLRGPQFLYGWAHFFNNYQYQWYEYGAGSLGDAQFYSEANIYEARPGDYCNPLTDECADPNPCGDTDYPISKEALVTFWTEENGYGNAKSVGDLALNGAEISVRNPDQVFSPAAEYSYQAEPADDDLRQRIVSGAGARVDYCR